MLGDIRQVLSDVIETPGSDGTYAERVAAITDDRVRECASLILDAYFRA